MSCISAARMRRNSTAQRCPLGGGADNGQRVAALLWRRQRDDVHVLVCPGYTPPDGGVGAVAFQHAMQPPPPPSILAARSCCTGPGAQRREARRVCAGYWEIQHALKSLMEGIRRAAAESRSDDEVDEAPTAALRAKPTSGTHPNILRASIHRNYNCYRHSVPIPKHDMAQQNGNTNTRERVLILGAAGRE